MINLLEETLSILKDNGKTPADIVWVGRLAKGWDADVPPISFTWDEFAALADFEYNCGYGGNEVCGTLKVVGKDWWLERGEYDGSEWWEFKTLPNQPQLAQARKSDLMED